MAKKQKKIIAKPTKEQEQFLMHHRRCIMCGAPASQIDCTDALCATCFHVLSIKKEREIGLI